MIAKLRGQREGCCAYSGLRSETPSSVMTPVRTGYHTMTLMAPHAQTKAATTKPQRQ